MPELSKYEAQLSIRELHTWANSPAGHYVLDWEQARFDAVTSDIFGYYALQFGAIEADFLRNNRMPCKQRVDEHPASHIQTAFEALPIASQSVDLIALPHVLEFHPDPHQVLREIERVLIPEGQLLITGFNPLSLWGLKSRCHRGNTYPWRGDFLSVLRLRDWLKLLGFEVDRALFGCFSLPLTQENWIKRWQFMENLGPRWWGFSGSVYFLRAIKRQHGLRLITPKWKTRQLAGKVLPAMSQKEGHGR